MDLLTWLVVVNLLPLAAVICIALPRARFMIPWLGLATVVVGTFPAFGSSAQLVAEGSIGVGLGWLMTTVYGLIGLGIVVGSVGLQPASFVSLGAIAVGLILVASFYAYLPPFNYGHTGMLVFATPGLALVAYGAVLWRRHGLEGSMRGRSSSLRLAVALGIVVGFGAIGLLAYEADRNERPNWAYKPLDLPQLATTSMLVVEGVVVRKEPHVREFQRSGGGTGRSNYTLYKIEVSQSWRGEEAETTSIAVSEFSPADLKRGQPYLLFFSERANQEDFPGHWRLFDPEQVWTVDGNSFLPYRGLTPTTPISRGELGEILAANPHS